MGTQVGVARKQAGGNAAPVQRESRGEGQSTEDPLQASALSDSLQDPLQHDGEVCEPEQDLFSADADQDQCVAPPDPACEQQNESDLSPVEQQRLRAVANILRYENENGTWATITNYNAITGDIPGRNVWVRTTDGLQADLCWMFDVALVAGGVGGTVGQILGAVGGRLGELIGAVLGQATGGLAYFGGRLIGAIVEGICGSSWDTFTGYLAGTVNEDNIAGADMALRLAWGNAFGGESLSIRELIAPSVIQQIECLGY